MTEVRIPATGNGVEDVLLVEWLVGDGARVEKGQPIFTIESDKSVIEVGAPLAGTLKIKVAQGVMFAVGQVIARIG